MEPPPFGSGNHKASSLPGSVQPTRQRASMEPPPFGSGNFGDTLTSAARTARFNGATAFRQWKRYWAVPQLAKLCFNGATAFRQWKPKPTARRLDQTSAAGCFNGATAFRQWKLWQHLPATADYSRQDEASMEPPPFGSGNWVTIGTVYSDPRGASFNGATAFRQWKLGITLKHALRAGAASMEPPPFGSGNSQPQATPISNFDASMEPPPFGSGNIFANVLLTAANQLGLQWSHRLSAVETFVTAEPLSDGSSCFNGHLPYDPALQWSHRLSAVETRAAKADIIATTGLQWSHRLSAVETGRAIFVLQWSQQWKRRMATASMEPPPFGSGNMGHPSAESHGSPRASMEPPPFGSGNLGADVIAAARRRCHASMEPPPFGSGNWTPRSFNGARVGSGNSSM